MYNLGLFIVKYNLFQHYIMLEKIFWIRHGESVANTHTYLHSLIFDPKLTYVGTKQMLTAAAELVNEDIEILICSPLKRSIESGQIIQRYITASGKIKPNIIICNSIKESGLGLDNITFSKSDTIVNNVLNIAPFSGYNKFIDLLENLKKKHKKIAIVGHQKINKQYIHNLSLNECKPMNNGAIVKMELLPDKTYTVENYLKT
jgi:broad specificity phosphatase PhoE